MKRLFVIAPCKMLVRSKTARDRFNKLSSRLFADGADPCGFHCLGCGFKWDDEPLTDWQNVYCSNCYSGRVLLVSMRLEFNSWGKQNGGIAEAKNRLEAARKDIEKQGAA